MNAPNFASVLDRPSASVQPPPAAPIGDYIWAITKLPRRDKSSNKGTEFVEFDCKCLGVVEGTVDDGELKEFGGVQAIPNHNLTFYMTEKSGYRLKDFLHDDLGLDWDENDTTLWQVSQEAVSAQFVGTVGHEPSQDNKRLFSRIVGTRKYGE